MVRKAKTDAHTPTGAHTPAIDIADHELKFGDHTMRVGDIAPASLIALIQKGFAHGLGNEVASRVATWCGAQTKAGNAPGDAEVAVATHDFRNEYLERLRKGLVGAGNAGGTRGGEVERMARQVATERVNAAIARKGLARAKVANYDELVKAKAALPDVVEEAKARIAAAKSAAEDGELEIELME